MKIVILTKVRRMFNTSSRTTNRHNQRQWVKSVRSLGPRYILAETLTKENPKPKHPAGWAAGL